MALASEQAVRQAIVAKLKTVTGIGQVYPRYRRPLKQGTEAEFIDLYCDGDKRVNVWMVRRVQRNPSVDEFNNVIAVVQVYELLGHYSYVDNDDDGAASETVFQELIEQIAAVLNEGLGVDGVTHRGLQIPSDITDSLLAEKLCHLAPCRLIVDVEDC